MKSPSRIVLCVLCVLSVLPSPAQNSLERNGLSTRFNRPAPIRRDTRPPLAGEWRRIGEGEPEWDMGEGWVEFYGEVLSNQEHGVRLQGAFHAPGVPGSDEFKGEFFVRNFPNKVAEGDTIGGIRSGQRLVAKISPLYSYPTVMRSDRTIRSLDYGQPSAPPKPREPSFMQKEIARVAAEKAAAAKVLADQEKEAKLLAWQRDQAEKGSASAQYDLGLRYLRGDGVETNAVKARAWLEKSAAQDHPSAKKTLTELSLSKGAIR